MSQKKGPTIEELVAKESVDLLSYMGWEKQEEKDVKEEVMIKSHFSCSFSERLEGTCEFSFFLSFTRIQ